ncbi:MAG: PLDc_N domain-containing protein [Lentisphaerae bacterium]|nr:PLDc_N domain-containing protein [Lentisphaerota bacterium]
MNEQLTQYLPFLIPLAVNQLGLMLAAVIHILRHNKYHFGNKALWLVISIFLSIIGPVLYFVIGRSDD